MIQRIQSVYLLLAGILPAFTITTPLARFYTDETAYLTLSALGLRATGTMQPTGTMPYHFALAVISLLLVALPLANIFLYRNRRRQMRLCNWVVVLGMAWYAAYIGLSVMLLQQTQATFSPALCAALPFLSIVLTLLAHRAVKKDEELVRAADRIR